MSFTEYRYSEGVLTRAEMIEKYGYAPSAIESDHHEWTINRAHASITFVTDDRGAHWIKKSVMTAAQRERRDLASFARDES